MKEKKQQRFRLIVQAISLALFNGYAVGFAKGQIFTGQTKGICVPVFNCYSCPGALGSCPIGGLQAVLGQPKHPFPFYVLGSIMLFGVVLGRLICGFLCPFGLIQDLLHKIPTKKIKVNHKIHRPLTYLKYIILLVFVIGLPILLTNKYDIGAPYFCKLICPAGTLEAGVPLVIANPPMRAMIGALFNWKVLTLVVTIVASLFISRPFCKYICPLGAIYSVFNKFSIYQMNLDQVKCVECKKCEKNCPMDVLVLENINSPECIRCNKCRAGCPTGAITSGFRNKV